MTALIPDAIRCSYNFPGHTPHWGRIQLLARTGVLARTGGRGVEERIISLVQQSPTSLLVATQFGTVATYYNHEPERLVKIWKLYPEAGRLYTAEGLIGVRHREHIAGEAHDAEYMFSITAGAFRTCRDIARDLAQFRPLVT